jgi:asparagine synthetase B (glutamine-hydrolysing)
VKDEGVRYAEEEPREPEEGIAEKREEKEEIVKDIPYESPAVVLLLGNGADEQMGGYGRHRTAFRLKGWKGLQDELLLDTTRLWLRNMGTHSLRSFCFVSSKKKKKKIEKIKKF